tara:strand:+ start:386 stop:1459 length:1074 start_codon:yes stop_codon:yes gene_type:complete
MIDKQFLETIPQYGIGGFVKKIFKKVKDTVKKVAPIAGAGIGFLIGGAAGAGIGSGIGSLIAGKSPEEALKNAALGYGIGSVAGSFGPFKQFAGKGIGGKFAMGDKYNILKSFTGPQEVVTSETSSAVVPKNEVSFLESKGINPEVFTKGDAETKKFITQKMIQESAETEVVKKGGSKLLGDGLASKFLTSSAIAAPFLTYYDAAKREKDFIPGDPMALNQLYYEDPQAFQVANLGVQPHYYKDLQNYYGVPIEDLPTDFIREPEVTTQAAKGGIIQLANGSEQYFPRKTGEINGPGTGTSDDIPAMLSDGEFVFTAKAVENAGRGSRREGAKKMYEVMKNLEKGGTLSTQSRGVAA